MGTKQSWITRKNKMKDLQKSIKGYEELCINYEKQITHLKTILGHYKYYNAPLFNDNEVAIVFKKRPTTMKEIYIIKEWFNLTISPCENDIKREQNENRQRMSNTL